MFVWLDEVGYPADINGLRRDGPAVEWLSVDAWAANQPWKEMLSRSQ